MNADRLLAYYEHVADAPDSVARLRRFILDLAVRGKLVPQNTNDEPASELLSRIIAEKLRLQKAGEIKADRPTNSCSRKSDEFSLPAGWACASLKDLCLSITDGDHLPPPKAVDGVPFLVISDVRSKIINYNSERRVPRSYYDALDPIRKPRVGDVLYTLVGSFGIPVHVTRDVEFCVQRHIGILRPWSVTGASFLTRFLESGFAFEQADRFATGIAQRTIPLSGLRSFKVPLPPLAEQHRIVAKVDELMSLCDRLESARMGREAARDRLAASILARLDAPDSETFDADARLALDALPELTTQPDQIKKIRKIILNLAVHGKLVPQETSEETTSNLLHRIRIDEDSLSSGEIASKNNEASGLNKPFDCPAGWRWTTVQGLLDGRREISYGVIKLGDEPKSGGVPTLRCSDVRQGYIDFSGIRTVNESIESDYKRTRLRGGEIVINIRGTLGGVALIPSSLAGFNVAREVAVIPIANDICGKFVVYLMLSPYFWGNIQNNLRGIAYKGLNLGILRDISIPLPPFAEQCRIADKVDQLMALCDRIEENLSASNNTRRRLLDALLVEALAPDEDHLLEAAE